MIGLLPQTRGQPEARRAELRSVDLERLVRSAEIRVWVRPMGTGSSLTSDRWEAHLDERNTS